MKTRFKGFSELSVAMFEQAPQNAPVSARPESGASTRVEGLERDVEALRAQLCEATEMQRATASKLGAAQKALARIQGENGRLQGELRKLAQQGASGAKQPSAAPFSAPTAQAPTRTVVGAPAGFDEAFPGEVREMVLTSLAEARDAAVRSARDRRASVLSAILSANRATGELERRRTALKQIMKDGGYFNDPRPLEKLGFRLISGRTHWKLQYADLRLPLAKTPSDYRSNLNAGNIMANRCF